MMEEPHWIDNYQTEVKARVDSDKKISLAKYNEVFETFVRPNLRYDETYTWDANINGIIVRYVGNSLHQFQFWVGNWWPAPNNHTTLAQAFIYSVSGVAGHKPFAYYCPENNTSIFLNTEYYGQCKSWALGMAAAALERHYNTHSIHGACADVDGKGVVMIAPTGTGKTTQVNRLFLHPQGRVLGDDWVYIRHPPRRAPDEHPNLVVTQPERMLYVRTENEEAEPWLRPLFDRCMVENAVDKYADCENDECKAKIAKGERTCVFDEGRKVCYWSFGNSRALLPREWMKGPNKVSDSAPLKLIALLRRNNESPAEQWLTPDEAIKILKEGKTMIRPGAGPKEKWGTYGYEPWYNPYLLVRDDDRQERFFREEMRVAKCVIYNTGAPGESIQRTHERILKAVAECE